MREGPFYSGYSRIIRYLRGMLRRQSCLGGSEPPAALAELLVARIGVVPLPCKANGTTHNRRLVLIPCGVSRSARPAYDRENQVRSLAGEPRIGTAEPVAVGSSRRPLSPTLGIGPQAMNRSRNIAILAGFGQPRGCQSPNMDWPHGTAFFENSCFPHSISRGRHADDGRRGRNPL
jgi:hypothetical protein